MNQVVCDSSRLRHFTCPAGDRALLPVPEMSTSHDVFAFEIQNDAAPEQSTVQAIVSLNAETTSRAQAYAGQVSYHWDVASDLVTWSANTKAVLGFDPSITASGRLFAGLMDGENFFSRYDTVLRSNQRDAGDGVGYEIEYRLRPDGKMSDQAVWIEDVGRWFAGPDGNPKEAIGIMRVANDRHERDQEMNFLSNCDPLTGMMNRVRMGDALGEAISVATADKNPCAFAIVAVNNLDVMNEAYGFEVADEVIVALGQRLRSVLRMGDGIARYSGSKFGVILNGCKPEELNLALERFMRAVRDSVIETQMGPVWALLSIGAVSLPAVCDTASVAIAHAEEALSEAFRLPSDGYVVFTTSDERKSRRLLNARCATEIVSCLRDGLFKLAFQPVFDAQTGKVVLHEALLRMADTTGALITAGHLVPIAERLGLIRLIDRAVLQLALQTLQNYSDAKLSINISATTVTDPRWNVQLLEMIAGAPEPASRLVVEITETAALDDLATSRNFVLSLRELGCGVALDDFGAGYTSYRNLKELPITAIKLDGSFCCNLQMGSENYTFVQSMVELAHAFGLKVVAEWVDTREDADALKVIGVDCLQGNMLGEASITAPWPDGQGVGFHFDPASLSPVDAQHFNGKTPDISEPRMTEVKSADARSKVFTRPALSSVSVSELDDATLDAEIAQLNEVSDDDQAPNSTVELSMQPAYETALETARPVVADNAREVREPEEQLEDNLTLLRQALTELSASLGVPADFTEAHRAAS
jgi:diguanylate cyclase (GGDEF)-like protein